MPSLNRIQLIGRLGKDPESRTTPGNRKVVAFSVATGHRWKDKQDSTDRKIGEGSRISHHTRESKCGHLLCGSRESLEGQTRRG
jgi:single-strand DNA-binding protein